MHSFFFFLYFVHVFYNRRWVPTSYRRKDLLDRNLTFDYHSVLAAAGGR